MRKYPHNIQYVAWDNSSKPLYSFRIQVSSCQLLPTQPGFDDWPDASEKAKSDILDEAAYNLSFHPNALP